MKSDNERRKSTVSKKCKTDTTRKFPEISGQNPPDLELTEIRQKKIGGPDREIRPKPSFSVGTFMVGIPLLVKHDKVPYFGISGKSPPGDTVSHVVFSHLSGAFCVGNRSAVGRGPIFPGKSGKIVQNFWKIRENLEKSGKIRPEIWRVCTPPEIRDF